MKWKRYFILLCLSGLILWIVNYLLMNQCLSCETDRISFLENEVTSLLNKNRILLKDIKGYVNRIRAGLINQNLDIIIDRVQANQNQINAKIKESKSGLYHRASNKTFYDESFVRLGIHEKTILPDDGPVIAVLVFSCNRITIQRSLDRLIQFRPSVEQFPIIVSQDCAHEETAKVILSYEDQVFMLNQPDQRHIILPPKEKKFIGYFKIARHYGWALNYTFLKLGFSTVIVVEDDIDISEDFYEYFLGTFPLLKADPTIWCISAWNDNGIEKLVDSSQTQLLYRTDFFPGLGWMLTNKVWEELYQKWPMSYWDDWMRQPTQRKNRSCIRPEISRTKTFGKVGVSNGLFYDNHLKFIKLNQKFINFTKMGYSHLLKGNYDCSFDKQVYDSPTITFSELKFPKSYLTGSVKILYATQEEYHTFTKQLGLLFDVKSGVGRTAYKGVVTFWQNTRRVYIAPRLPWSGYNTSWS